MVSVRLPLRLFLVLLAGWVLFARQAIDRWWWRPMSIGEVVVLGGFKAQGEIPGVSSPESGATYWSSWSGEDRATGDLMTAAFPAPRELRAWVRGSIYGVKPNLYTFLCSTNSGTSDHGTTESVARSR